MNSEKPLKISFYGESGSGKGYVAEHLKTNLELSGTSSATIDIATPLHHIQAAAAHIFRLPERGQDGALLQFLAHHFVSQMARYFDDQLHALETGSNPPDVIINSDCRNNMYSRLKDYGFLFFHIVTPLEVRIQRLARRQDITDFDPNVSVNKIDSMVADYVLISPVDLDDLTVLIQALVDKKV